MMRSSWALVVVVLATSLAACGDGEPVSGGRAAPAERAPARAASDSSPRDVRIRPKRGIAGVLLEMSRAAVTHILGAADAVKPSELHTGWTQEIYGRRRLRVTSDELGSVWDVRTYSREQRAPGGVGVGSGEGQLRRVVPSLRCRTWGGPARYRLWRSCVDAPEGRGPFTQYRLVRGRVTRVLVARGLAL